MSTNMIAFGFGMYGVIVTIIMVSFARKTEKS